MGSRSFVFLFQNGRNSMEIASSEAVLLPFPDGKWLSEPYSLLAEIPSGLESSNQPEKSREPDFIYWQSNCLAYSHSHSSGCG